MLKRASLLCVSLILSINVSAMCMHPLFNSQKLDSNLSKLQVSANSITLKEGVYFLDGEVSLHSNQYAISGDRMTVDTASKKYDAYGNVQVQTKNIQAQSENLEIDASGDIILQADNISYNYNSLANGFSHKISISDSLENFEDVTYTTCDTADPSWQLSAESITLDKAKNRGSAKNTAFDFFGVTLLTLPKYKWILKGRESGVLFPEFSFYERNNETGYKARVPYYINLSSEYDMTLTSGIISSRGKTLGIEYRHLLAISKKDGYFQWNSEYLPNDKKTDKNRWVVKNTYTQKFGDIAISANIHRASDAYYFNDIAFKNYVERLESDLLLTYQHNGWFASVFSEVEQVINGTPLYTRDSEIILKKSLQFDEVMYDVRVINTKFDHKDNTKITGNRSYAEAKIATNITSGNAVITPQVFFNTTQYTLNNASNQQRNIAGVNIDSKLFYERGVELFGTNMTQTLTPRLAYFYNPDKDQSSLPNFDSERQALSYESLFSNTSWSGLDRVDYANTIALGFESQLINTSNGKTLFTTSIGRNINIDTKEKSNLFFAVDALYNKLHLYNSLEYDSKIVARNSLLSLRNSGTYFTSIGHHLVNENKYVSLHISIPIFGKSHIFTGVKHALNENKTNKRILGFMYGSCCFAFRAAHSREYNSSSNSFDSSTSIEFIFKGLGSSDEDLHENIKQNIPEYINDTY